MMEPENAASMIVSAVIVIAIAAVVVFGTFLAFSPNSTHMTTNVGTQSITKKNSISLQGFSLCATNCFYPSPYLSGMILINGTVPISSVVMYVNGTYNGFAIQYPSFRTLECTGSANQSCTVKAGGICISSGAQTSCTFQYASCSIESSSNTSCTATLTGGVNTLTAFDQMYKGSLPDSLLPAVANDSYAITCFALFQDNSHANATTVIIAH